MRSRKRNSANFFFDYQESTTTASPTKKFNNSSGSSFPSSKDGPAMGNYDPKYPESFTAFADGLKSDVMELLGTSAGLLNRSINFIFPFMGYDSVETSINDSLHDIEVMNPKSSKTRQQQQQQLQQKQSQDALKLRCQSLWTKENQNSYQITTENSSNSSSHAQKGGKVLLDKLAKNNNIQSYPCGDSDDHLVILGNVRMIVAKKNYDTINSASILWSQPFREIATCAINCTLRYTPHPLPPLRISLSLLSI